MSLKNSAPVQALTGRKLVESPVLNRMGLQVARTYGARWVYNLRSTRAPDEIATWTKQLRREGMVVVENFMSDSDFETVQAAAAKLLAEKEESLVKKQHGPTNYSIAVLGSLDRSDCEPLDPFFADPRIAQLLTAAEKRDVDISAIHRAVEWVRQGESTTEGDPETDLHSDIFYNTHKAWLYLTEVTPESAPLVYVKGSHRLNRFQAGQIYRHSCNPETPSRRITQSELDRLGLKEEALQCKPNTLVVANVCGYHRRSVGQPGGERIALHCSVRSQPFALWKNK